MRKIIILSLCMICTVCSTKKEQKRPLTMNDISTAYIKLTLEVGQYVPDYIDAYYGPDTLKPKELTEEEKKQFPKEAFLSRADSLINMLEELQVEKLTDLEKLRHEYLRSQLRAMKAQVEIRGGRRMTFEEEAEALYEANPPKYGAAHFDSILVKLDVLLPGKGDVVSRLETYKKQFIIPKEKLDTVFQAAIKEARARTMKHMDLPTEENFKVEYVTNKAWSGYNWFKGNSYSLIQVNTDLPIFIDRAIDLACHEGYPGHHVYHLMLEKNLVNGKGWWEYSVYPLFSPQAMISEGSANYGIEVAFPGEERVDFEKNVLFPLAGLDTTQVDAYYQIQKYTNHLSYAGNEAARGYLNGTFTKDEAIQWLSRYALMSKERATQRISFIEKYRSYVINYNLGQDMVKAYVEKKVGSSNNRNKKWEAFKEIISTPRTPKGMM